MTTVETVTGAAKTMAAACDLRYGGCDDRILWLAVLIVLTLAPRASFAPYGTPAQSAFEPAAAPTSKSVSSPPPTAAAGPVQAPTTEAETRALAGLPVNASIEQVDRTEGLKLDNGAQAMDIPGIDLSKLPPDRRVELLKKLNAESCTCGCDLTVAKCRVDDPSCGVSLPLARKMLAYSASWRTSARTQAPPGFSTRAISRTAVTRSFFW